MPLNITEPIQRNTVTMMMTTMHQQQQQSGSNYSDDDEAMAVESLLALASSLDGLDLPPSPLSFNVIQPSLEMSCPVKERSEAQRKAVATAQKTASQRRGKAFLSNEDPICLALYAVFIKGLQAEGGLGATEKAVVVEHTEEQLISFVEMAFKLKAMDGQISHSTAKEAGEKIRALTKTKKEKSASEVLAFYTRECGAFFNLFSTHLGRAGVYMLKSTGRAKLLEDKWEIRLDKVYSKNVGAWARGDVPVVGVKKPHRPLFGKILLDSLASSSSSSSIDSV